MKCLPRSGYADGDALHHTPNGNCWLDERKSMMTGDFRLWAFCPACFIERINLDGLKVFRTSATVRRDLPEKVGARERQPPRSLSIRTGRDGASRCEKSGRTIVDCCSSSTTGWEPMSIEPLKNAPSSIENEGEEISPRRTAGLRSWILPLALTLP